MYICALCERLGVTEEDASSPYLRVRVVPRDLDWVIGIVLFDKGILLATGGTIHRGGIRRGRIRRGRIYRGRINHALFEHNLAERKALLGEIVPLSLDVSNSVQT